MPTQNSKHRLARLSASTRTASLTLVIWLLSDSVAMAAEPGVELRTATYFESLGGHSEAYASVGTQLTLAPSSSGRPVNVGVFVDLEVTSRRSNEYLQLIGGWAGYDIGRWQFSATGAYFESEQLNGIWIYASKLQFELRPGHKLSLTAAGAIKGRSDPTVRLIYKTRLSQNASLALSIGLGENRPLDYGAKTDFAWNIL